MAKKSKSNFGSMKALRFGPHSIKGNPYNPKKTNTGV